MAKCDVISAALFSVFWGYSCIKFYQEAQQDKTMVYIPCNDEPCIYYNFDSADLPRAVRAVLGRNGQGWEVRPGYAGADATLWRLNSTLPLTIDPSRCESLKNNIDQRLQGSPSGYGFAVSALLKSLFDFIHDVLLLSGEREHHSIPASCAPFFFLGLTCVFSLSMGSVMAEVFQAKEDNRTIPALMQGKPPVCIYQLGSVDSILAVVGPVLLVNHFFHRYQKLLQAATFGDYLFSWRGLVPHRVLRNNARDADAWSLDEVLMVPSVIGDALPTQHTFEGGLAAAYWKGVRPALPPCCSWVCNICKICRLARDQPCGWKNLFWSFVLLLQLLFCYQALARIVDPSVDIYTKVSVFASFTFYVLGCGVVLMLASRSLTKESEFVLACVVWVHSCVGYAVKYLTPVLVRGSFYGLRFLVGSLPMNVENVGYCEAICVAMAPLLQLYVLYTAFAFCRQKHAGETTGTFFIWQKSEVEEVELIDYKEGEIVVSSLSLSIAVPSSEH